MKRLLLTAFAIFTLAAPAALAQPIEKRKDIQKERIKEGVESGELNKAEAARLKARERKLNRDIRQDRRDGGGLSPAERAKINARQDQLSRDIAKQKHDAQKTAPK